MLKQPFGVLINPNHEKLFFIFYKETKMKTEIKNRMKGLLFLIITICFIQIYSPSDALGNKFSEKKEKHKALPGLKNTKEENSGQRIKDTLVWKRTVIKKWNCKTNSWETWKCNESGTNCEKGKSVAAYTHIQVWNNKTGQWEPFPNKEMTSSK
jgi:hypothetical protein